MITLDSILGRILANQLIPSIEALLIIILEFKDLTLRGIVMFPLSPETINKRRRFKISPTKVESQ